MQHLGDAASQSAAGLVTGALCLLVSCHVCLFRPLLPAHPCSVFPPCKVAQQAAAALFSAVCTVKAGHSPHCIPVSHEGFI